jgi:hypothetical protein
MKRRQVVLALLGTFLLYGCGSSSSTSPPKSHSTRIQGRPLGQRTKTHGCVVHTALQDSACTPGEILRGATKAQICVLGYSRRVRRVSSSTKRRVFAEYGVRRHPLGSYEVDHLVSLELGGSNGIANLWPEAAEPRPGFHEKDRVENYLHAQVCAGKISLAKAQQEIATNWLAVYHSAGLG